MDRPRFGTVHAFSATVRHAVTNSVPMWKKLSVPAFALMGLFIIFYSLLIVGVDDIFKIFCPSSYIFLAKPYLFSLHNFSRVSQPVH
jgi:hypothetical protein